MAICARVAPRSFSACSRTVYSCTPTGKRLSAANARSARATAPNPAAETCRNSRRFIIGILQRCEIVMPSMRMWPGVRRAARGLHRVELHELDAGSVGIVEVELPFAVAAELLLLVFAGLPAARAQQLGGVANRRNAQRDVVQYSERAR